MSSHILFLGRVWRGESEQADALTCSSHEAQVVEKGQFVLWASIRSSGLANPARRAAHKRPTSSGTLEGVNRQ